MLERDLPNLSDSAQSTAPTKATLPELERALKASQIDVEAEKAVLARVLHDDLGGLLVGAIMDIGWILQQQGHSPAVKDRLERASGLLRSAIDMKRDLIENLRPTLLDNVGLFSTLRWHLKASCEAAGVAYVEDYPDAEAALPPEVRIGVFRIMQEALKHLLNDGVVSHLSLEVKVEGETLHCRLQTELVAPRDAEDKPSGPQTSMQQRARRMGGTLRWLKESSGDHLDLEVPLGAEN